MIGNEGKLTQDLLLKCERPKNCTQEYSLDRFKKLAIRVDQLLGLPEVVSVWSNADFGKFQIRRIRYNQSLELIQSEVICDGFDNGRVFEDLKGQSGKIAVLGAFAKTSCGSMDHAPEKIELSSDASMTRFG